MKPEKMSDHSKWFRFLNFVVCYIMIPLSIIDVFIFKKVPSFDFLIVITDGLFGGLYLITGIIESVKIQKRK